MTDVNTSRAVRAVLQAARTEHDFAGWLAHVLAQVAGQLGSASELTIGRPGSWEAALVDQLVHGTVGYDSEALPPPLAKLTDAQVREIRWRYDSGLITQRELAAEYGVACSTISDITTCTTWEWLP